MVSMNELVAQAQAMQEKVRRAQNALADQTVTGSSGGGLVKITMTCVKEANKCEIDASLLSEGEKKNLQDLVVAAFNNAKEKAEEIATAVMEEATSGLKLPPGVDVPT